MTCYAWDSLLIGALLVGMIAVYAFSRFLYYEKKARAIQQEMDELEHAAARDARARRAALTFPRRRAL